MKHFLALFVLLAAVVGHSQIVINGGTAGITLTGTVLMTSTNSAAVTLLESSITSGGGAHQFGSAAAKYYAANAHWTNASPRTVKKVVFRLNKIAGTIVGKNYTARIWTMTGDDLTTEVGTSDAVAGSDGWSNTDVEFTFSTPVSLSAATEYAFTVDAGVSDASNYAGGLNTTPKTIPGWLTWQRNTLLINSASTNYNLMMAIYVQ